MRNLLRLRRRVSQETLLSGAAIARVLLTRCWIFFPPLFYPSTGNDGRRWHTLLTIFPFMVRFFRRALGLALILKLIGK